MIKYRAMAESSFLGIERFFAGIILVGVFIHFYALIPTWLAYDWSQADQYIHFLEGVFSLAIGIELARLFTSYSVEAVVELVVFVIARKLLFVENMSAVLLGTAAITLLFAVLILPVIIQKISSTK